MGAINAGRYCLDAGFHSPGNVDDARTGLLLWGDGEKKECSFHHHDELYDPGSDWRSLGGLRLQPGLRPGCRWNHRQPELCGFK